MDPLSEMLIRLPTTGRFFGINHLRGAWSFVTPELREDLAFGAFVADGAMWVKINDEPWFEMRGGDSVIIPGPAQIAYASGRAQPSANVSHILADRGIDLLQPARIETPISFEWGDGPLTCKMLAFGMSFSGRTAPHALSLMRPFKRFDTNCRSVTRAAQTAVDMIDEEMRDDSSGYQALAANLAELILTAQYRAAQKESADSLTASLYRGFGDPLIGRALSAIHAHPDRNWTLDMLARTAGMSVANMTRRFRGTMGMSPMAVVTEWRMSHAADLLQRNGSANVEEIASQSGYASERAFRAAFERFHGASPAAYAKQFRPRTTEI